MSGSTTTHTLSVLVEDKPGVLARVAALFSRRGFNIESLAVGATEQKDMSRMTIVVSAESTPLEQITKQLNKLINVIKIIEQDDDNSVARELALIKVRADAGEGIRVHHIHGRHGATEGLCQARGLGNRLHRGFRTVDGDQNVLEHVLLLELMEQAALVARLRVWPA